MTDGLTPAADAPTLDTAGTPPIEPAVEAVAPEPVPAATPGTGRRRALRLIAGIYWLVARLFAIGLFVGGLALGYNAFLNSQQPDPVAVDPSVAGVATPVIVAEFITALTADDSDALRSVVPEEPYQLLITEMTRWGFTSITEVETLMTVADDTRTATAVVLIGQTDLGVPHSINLIVHVDNGQIVSFR